MPAEGTLPAACALALACTFVTAAACTTTHIERYGALEWSPDKSHVAFSRDRLCEKGPCESLYVGATVESAAGLEGLADGQESCDEIAWTREVRGLRCASYSAKAGAISPSQAVTQRASTAASSID